MCRIIGKEEKRMNKFSDEQFMIATMSMAVEADKSPRCHAVLSRLKIIFAIQLLSVFRIGKSKLHIFGSAGMQKSLY